MLVAAMLGIKPAECRILYADTDGWSWLECPGKDAFAREVARSLRTDFKPLIYFSGKAVSPSIELFKTLDESVILNGCFQVETSVDKLEVLSKLAHRIAMKKTMEGDYLVTACFQRVDATVLLEQGIVPLPWKHVGKNSEKGWKLV